MKHWPPSSWDPRMELAVEVQRKKNTMRTQELLTTFRWTVGVLRIFQEAKGAVLLWLGASIPFSILDHD